jgi:NADPH:quinone reductase-like Zn-dependent oxidoreductase
MTNIVRFHETGGPEVLKLEALELPPPGVGELRIGVRAIGLNRAEAAFRAGKYRETPVLPSGLGYEAAGVVEKVGEEVVGFKVGDRIATIPAFPQGRYGVYGESAIVPAHAVVPYLEELSYDENAAIWMQYLTAWGGLIKIARLGRGDFVVIPAATSSVGLAAIQIARAVGARPIALTRTSAKRAALERSVPGTPIVCTEEQDLETEIFRLTDRKGARVVFDPVGGSTFGSLAKTTEAGGILVVYGALSPDPTPLPTFDLMGKGLTVRGYGMSEISRRPETLSETKAFVIACLKQGLFRPVIARTFPLTEIVAAHRFLESNEHVGKIVVQVSV